MADHRSARDPRRIRLRVAVLWAALSAAGLGALAVSWAGLTTLRGRADYLLPVRPADDLVEQVGAAMLVGALLALLAAAAGAALLSRALGRQLAALRASLTPSARGSAGPLGIREVHALGQAAREQREAEASARAALERERDQLGALVGAVGEGILQLDGGGRVVRANPSARLLLALPEAPEGAAFSTLVRHGELRRVLQTALEGTSVGPAELTVGDRRLLVVAQRLGEGGEGTVVVLVDTTELRRLESVRRDFVANASHELKTPLTSIRGYAETLFADDPPAELRRQFLATIRDNAERLQRIVDDLLDLSRLESGAWVADLHEVDLEEAVRDVWRPCEQRAAAAGVALQIDDSARRTLRADPLALRQILSNLLDNALRHTPAGGRISVRVRTLPPEETRRAAAAAGAGGPASRRPLVALEVSDTGGGIPLEAVPRIFERFYRVDPARSRSEGGTGLGLAIVKHLAEAMGGGVEADSALGRGTTIRVLLPVP